MDHNLGVGKCHTLALCARAEQESTHACSHAHTNRSHITLDVLHGVIDRHTGSYTAAGAVDIKLNILVRVLGFQVQKLCYNQTGSGIIDLFGQENNAVVQQTGKNIIASLATTGLLNNIGN